MVKKYIIGIDLGTTNSCVAIMEGKNVNVLTSQEGDNTVPSIVAYKGGETLVGAAAKRQSVTNPTQTLYSTKRFIGRSFDDSKEDIDMVPYKVVNEQGSPRFLVEGKNIMPEQVAAKILEKMKGIAEEYIGSEGQIEGAVVTVPAYFDNTQKTATMNAGEIAGIDVKRIINEPTAAAMAYGLENKKETKHIVVFDFGGGTFDISVLEIGGGVIEVKATSGDNHLGGDDIDHVLIDHIIDTFKRDKGINLKKDPMALQRIKEAAEKAKKELSGVLATEIILPFITMTAEGAQHLNMNLTRDQFNEMIDPVIERLIAPCENALKKSGVSKSQISSVLAVGGSTRIPLVEEKAKRIFGQALDKSKNPDTIVAQGAAIQGAVLSGDVSDVVLLDTLPIAIGLETEGGIFTAIVKEGETIPTANEETFTTASDNQPSVTIRVLQGASDMAARNKEIGRFDLSGIAPVPRGVPQISVKFEVNSNGVLKCTARDTKTGKETTKEIIAKNGLSDEIVAELKKEAEKYRKEDSKKKEFIQTKHEAQSTAKQAVDVVKEFGEKVAKETVNEISKAAEDLKTLAEVSSNVDELKAEIEKLKQLMQQVGQTVYGNDQQQDPNPEPQEAQQAEAESAKQTSKNDEIV